MNQLKGDTKIEYNKNKNREPAALLNERALKFYDVLVIGPEGEQMGVMTSKQALSKARELGLDLFVVSPKNTPPVCKIVNYGKFKYEEDKKKKQAHKPIQKLKEVKVSPVIAQHDLDTMTNRAKEFLRKGHKVKLTCVFKAREVQRPALGEEKLKAMQLILCEFGEVELAPKLEGKLMSMIMIPK